MVDYSIRYTFNSKYQPLWKSYEEVRSMIISAKRKYPAEIEISYSNSGESFSERLNWQIKNVEI